MFIRRLDFLSSPPQMFIFKQKTNKTLFGGILFIIYIIIMLIISLIFILNFAFNNKYNIRYTLYKDFTNTEEENNKNEDLNPHLNFSINLQKISIHNAIEAKNIEESGFLIISDENSKIIDKFQLFLKLPQTSLLFLLMVVCLIALMNSIIKKMKQMQFII